MTVRKWLRRLGLPETSRDDVIQAYQMFLGRDPEDECAIERHLQNGSDIWALIRNFMGSLEFRRRASAWSTEYRQHLGEISRVEVLCEPHLRVMMIDHIKQVWTTYGDADPHFSVLTNPKFRSEMISADGVDQFFKTGQREVEFFEGLCKSNRLQLGSAPTMVELGCGLGRIAEHMSGRVAEYVGVDISSTHLERARERADARGLTNVSFITLEEFLESNQRFDIFYSILTLQHNPPPVALWLLQQGLARVNSGGIVYFQVPSYIYDYSFDAETYVRNLDALTGMEMHPIPQSHVFNALLSHGFTPVEVFQDWRIGNVGISYSFLARLTDEA